MFIISKHQKGEYIFCKKKSTASSTALYPKISNYFFLINKPLTKATIDTITGVNTMINVARFTLAAKATGKIPKPELAGASKSKPSETRYNTATIIEINKPQIASGNKNSLFFSRLSFFVHRCLRNFRSGQYSCSHVDWLFYGEFCSGKDT